MSASFVSRLALVRVPVLVTVTVAVTATLLVAVIVLVGEAVVFGVVEMTTSAGLARYLADRSP